MKFHVMTTDKYNFDWLNYFEEQQIWGTNLSLYLALALALAPTPKKPILKLRNLGDI